MPANTASSAGATVKQTEQRDKNMMGVQEKPSQSKLSGLSGSLVGNPDQK